MHEYEGYHTTAHDAGIQEALSPWQEVLTPYSIPDAAYPQPVLPVSDTVFDALEDHTPAPHQQEAQEGAERLLFSAAALPDEPTVNTPSLADWSPEDVPILSSYEQYVSELWQIQRLTEQQQHAYVERARNGDQIAKQALIADCLGYVMHIARRYSVYVEHDDLMDIVGVGNLAVTEKVDLAIEKAPEHPIAYLCGVAKRSISNYCLYRSRLIPITSRTTPMEDFPKVESLDVLIERSADEDLPIQPLTSPDTQTSEQDRDVQEEADAQQLLLVRSALHELSDKQREVIEMRYGLTGHDPVRLADIARQFEVPPIIVTSRHKHGIKNLRAKLQP